MSVNRAHLQQAKDLRLKRGLSQNFLINDKCLTQIAASVIEGDPDTPIVEIGAGAGFLTQLLLASGHAVTAIEIDARMIPVLKAMAADYPTFSLIHKDVRQVDLLPLLQPKGAIIGNIPYHLSGPILFQIAGEMADPDYPLRKALSKVVLMVQKEVGDRLLAKPGDKAYSQLTLQIQYHFETSPILFVPRGAFYPSPKVDSMVVQLVPRETPAIEVRNLAFLSRLIKTCFEHRRKTLLNNLKLGSFGNDEYLKKLLDDLGISHQARPQELPLAQFGALADALAPVA